MKATGFVCACVAAMVGALIWGLISWSTNFEIGYIAWGIGLLVGLAAAFCGSRGSASGVACAALAILSIGAGKYLAVAWSVSDTTREISSLIRDSYSQELFAELQADAAEFKKVRNEEQYAKFMTVRGFSEGQPTEDELREFKDLTVPMLQQIERGELSFEAWRTAGMQAAETDLTELKRSSMSLLFESLNAFDLLWALLGISTAYKVGSGSDD